LFEYLGYILFYVVVVWYLHRKITANARQPEPEEEPEPEEPPEFDALRMQREVIELHNRMRELEKLDKLIIDLRLCRPSESVKAFRLEWMSTSGAENQLDLLADGENALTKQLIITAEAHRVEMNREVIQRIYDLYTVCCERDYQNARHSPEFGEISD
jgi:hypothetical protein